VNCEAQRWDRSAIGLIQTRNFQKEIGRNFAAEFGQISHEVSDLVAHQPIAEINVYQNEEIQVPPVQLQRKEYSISFLVINLLRNLIPLDAATNEPRRWREFDLAITIYHDQKTPFPIAYWGAPTNDSQRFIATSQFPLQSIRVGASQTAAQDQDRSWFDGPYKDYTIDFHWFSAANMPFFGIRGVKVTIVP
jgi:hypothetical protein